MSATYANVFPLSMSDGITYASAKNLPTTEADLFNQTTPPGLDPVPILYGQSVVAIFTLTASGTPDTATSYVVLQTNAGGDWIDVAWVLWTTTTGSADFLISGGAVGANSIQQTRANGTAPSSNGSNQFPLGGVIRFTGQTALSGGSSPHVAITLKYKIMGLR
jgi:hypothetical protein